MKTNWWKIWLFIFVTINMLFSAVSFTALYRPGGISKDITFLKPEPNTSSAHSPACSLALHMVNSIYQESDSDGIYSEQKVKEIQLATQAALFQCLEETNDQPQFELQ